MLEYKPQEELIALIRRQESELAKSHDENETLKTALAEMQARIGKMTLELAARQPLADSFVAPVVMELTPLFSEKLDRIARSYFSEPYGQEQVKHAIHDAFIEFRASQQVAGEFPPQVCGDPAACERSGCCNPNGRCEEAARTVQKPAAVAGPECWANAINALLSVATAAYEAMDNSEERANASGGEDAEYIIQGNDFTALSAAMDEIDALPDDRPGYTLAGGARASWALRDLFTTPIPAPAAAVVGQEAFAYFYDDAYGNTHLVRDRWLELLKCGYVESPLYTAPVPTAGVQGDADMLRDMLAIQDACGLHTDEYAPGSVIEYIKELEAENNPPAKKPISKEWCERMAKVEIEADCNIEAGSPDSGRDAALADAPCDRWDKKYAMDAHFGKDWNGATPEFLDFSAGWDAKKKHFAKTLQRTDVAVIDRINLLHGAYITRETKTTGANGWLLRNEHGLVRALNVFESEFVDCALAAHPAPSSDAALVAALKDIAESCNCCGDRSDLSQIAQDALDAHPAPSSDAALVAEVVDNGGKRFCMLMDWDALPVGTKVYLAAYPANGAKAGVLPEGWRIVPKKTCYALVEGNSVIASLAGPDAEENAAIIARILAATKKGA